MNRSSASISQLSQPLSCRIECCAFAQQEAHRLHSTAKQLYGARHNAAPYGGSACGKRLYAHRRTDSFTASGSVLRCHSTVLEWELMLMASGGCFAGVSGKLTVAYCMFAAGVLLGNCKQAISFSKLG